MYPAMSTRMATVSYMTGEATPPRGEKMASPTSSAEAEWGDISFK